jgi:DNA-nicking Smr family endonuclease
MIKVGDKVKFLNDVGGGVVTRFLNKNMVMVENYDGFEIPYLINQLIDTSAPELNVGTASQPKQNVQTEIAPRIEMEETPGEIINGKNSPDFYFCFVPADSGNPLASEIKLFLVNDSNFTVLYRYSYITENGFETVKHGTLQSNSKILLENIVQSDLSELPEYGFQIIYFQNKENEWNEPITKQFKVNPVKFYKEKSFHANQLFKKNAMVLQITKNILTTEIDKLTEADFQKVVAEKEQEPLVEKIKPKRTNEIVEVDLHINELVDNAQGLSNHEILEIQKEKVETEIKAAVQTGVKKIVFIHGVGQGVLKQEVINLLKSKFRKYYFQDASFKEYGYGATMVIIRK